MNDVQLLFVVLVVLYGWECLLWVRRGQVVFFTWLGQHWHPAHPGGVFGNHRGGFILAPALPPLGTVLTAANFPVSVSPDGVLAYISAHVNPAGRPAQSVRYLPFEKWQKARANGKKLQINGEFWLTLPTATATTALAEELTHIASLKPADRLPEIKKQVRARFDRRALEQRWQEFQAFARLRWLGNAVFVYLAGVAPVVIWNFGLSHTWGPLLGTLFALTFTTGWCFRRAHKKLYPRAEDERFTYTLLIALSPVTTIRVLDPLSRPLVEAFHPLTVGKFFMRADEFSEFARPLLLNLRHPALPVCPGESPAAAAVETASRALMLQAAEEFLKREDCNPDDLCRPAPPTDSTNVAYCPRCGTQFTTTKVTCADCGGMALMAFASTRAVKSDAKPA